MKTEVYSWRVSPELKSRLEREAQRRKTSFSAVLELAARDFLEQAAPKSEDDQEQERIRRAAFACIGAIEGSDPSRAQNASAHVKQLLRQRHGR